MRSRVYLEIDTPAAGDNVFNGPSVLVIEVDDDGRATIRQWSEHTSTASRERRLDLDGGPVTVEVIER